MLFLNTADNNADNRADKHRQLRMRFTRPTNGSISNILKLAVVFRMMGITTVMFTTN